MSGRRAILVLAVVAVTGAALALPVPALASPAFNWGPATMPDRAVQGGGDALQLTAASCLTSSDCVAVDSSGNVLTSSNPAAASGGSGPGSAATWTPQTIDAGVALKALSCVKAPATLTAVEKLKNGKVVGVAASGQGRKIVVGANKAPLLAGRTTAVAVALGASGKSLLKRFHKLPATLRITLAVGTKTTTVAIRTVTIL